MSEHSSHHRDADEDEEKEKHAAHEREEKEEPRKPAAREEIEPPPDPGPPPQDLTLKNEVGQDPSEAIIANRGMVVESTNPADLVPNTPQIRPPAAG